MKSSIMFFSTAVSLTPSMVWSSAVVIFGLFHIFKMIFCLREFKSFFPNLFPNFIPNLIYSFKRNCYNNRTFPVPISRNIFHIGIDMIAAGENYFKIIIFFILLIFIFSSTWTCKNPLQVQNSFNSSSA